MVRKQVIGEERCDEDSARESLRAWDNAKKTISARCQCKRDKWFEYVSYYALEIGIYIKENDIN